VGGYVPPLNPQQIALALQPPHPLGQFPLSLAAFLAGRHRPSSSATSTVVTCWTMTSTASS